MEGPDLRPELRRLDEPRARDAEVRQHRVRAARPRPRARRASPTRPRRWASRRSSTATRPRGWAASRAASRRSRWRTPTRRSRPAASATSRSRSQRVTFPDGEVEDLGKPKRERVFSDAVAYEVTKILKQNVQSRAPGTRANIGCPSAGKTGTTDNFNDAWFDGYTPHLATAVWVGYPDALREMRSVHGISVAGGTFPAMIWNKFMQVAKGDNCDDFPQPKSSISWSPFFGKYSKGGVGHTPTARAAARTLRRQHRRRLPGLRSAPLRRAAGAHPPMTDSRAAAAGAARRRPAATPAAPARASRHPGRSRALAVLGSSTSALAVPVGAPRVERGAGHGGGSPDWLLGPLRAARRRLRGRGARRAALLRAACGSRCSPTSRCCGWARGLAGAHGRDRPIVAAHVLFLLAPPLLSQDVFSYISYARLDVVHGLDPYTHSPDDVPGDAVYPVRRLEGRSRACTGRSSRVATFPLAKLSVPAAFWTLKAVAALAEPRDRRARVVVRAAARARSAPAGAGGRPQPAGARARRRRRAQRRAHRAAVDGRGGGRARRAARPLGGRARPPPPAR